MYRPDDDDEREEGRRLNAEAKGERLKAHQPPDCECGGYWEGSGYDPADGADAHGRRGQKLWEWECSGCGALATTTEG